MQLTPGMGWIACSSLIHPSDTWGDIWASLRKLIPQVKMNCCEYGEHAGTVGEWVGVHPNPIHENIRWTEYSGGLLRDLAQRLQACKITWKLRPGHTGDAVFQTKRWKRLEHRAVT